MIDIKSSVEFGKEAAKGIAHLAHCAGQLACFYIIEKCDEADRRLAEEVEIPGVD